MTDHLRVAPFNGYRYSGAKIPDLSQVIAPPYDMIPPAMQEILHDRHPRNIVRLILSRHEGDDGFKDRYERAAAAYRNWKESGILVRDRDPSIYAYRQDYEWGGNTFQRLGFIARVALTEFGEGAFPHESTLKGPKADRLKLLTASRANFSCIFSLFSDAEGRVQDRLAAETAAEPQVEVKDDLGVSHKLWQLSRPEFHSWIDSQMREKQFIIADGHHRYETALEYRRLMRERPGGFDGDCDYVMMFLAPIESKGLTILPFHRVLTLDSPESALEQLRRGFDVAEHPVGPSTAESCGRILGNLEEAPLDRPAYVFYPGGERAFLLTKREDTDLSELLREGTSGRVGELDVTILHQAVIGSLLGLDEQNLVQQGKVSFYPRPEEAFEDARDRADRAAFFIRPTRIDQVWKIALSGQKMPQKSTNFYPKLTSGLVINEL